MEPLTFDASLATGFETLDEQHQMFLDMLEELAQRIEDGAHRQGFLDALQGMKFYADSHFSDEEALMERQGYPALSRHRALHDTFRRMTEDLQSRASEGPGLISLEMLEFLGQWFIGHIRDADQRFAAFARSQGGAAAG